VGKNGPEGVRLAVKIQLSYIQTKLGLKSFSELKCIYAGMGEFHCIVLIFVVTYLVFQSDTEQKDCR
jgi:hypothetical protein